MRETAAQDFAGAFGLGGGDGRRIASVDADGVAMAALHGLAARRAALEDDVAALARRASALADAAREGAAAVGAADAELGRQVRWGPPWLSACLALCPPRCALCRSLGLSLSLPRPFRHV